MKVEHGLFRLSDMILQHALAFTGLQIQATMNDLKECEARQKGGEES